MSRLTTEVPAGRDSTSRRAAWTVAVPLGLACVLILPLAIRNPMASTDEAWYASISRDIVDSGDWLTLHYNGEPWWEKPPLAIWGTAVAFQCLGVWELPARLVSVLSGLGAVAMVYAFMRRRGGAAAGMLAGFILLTAQDFLRFSAKGQLDVPLALLLSLQLILFWWGRERPSLLLLSGVCMGLAVATKNQAGLLGAGVAAVYMLAARDFGVLRRPQFYAGAALAAAVGLSWHVYQYAAYGNAFLEAFLDSNCSSAWTEWDRSTAFNHLKYLLERHNVLVAFASVGLVWAGWRYVKHRDRLALFLAVWVAGMLGACLAWPRPQYWYLLPMYPGVALLSAGAICRTGLWRRCQWAVLSAVAAWAVVFQITYHCPPPKEVELWAARRMAGDIQAAVPSSQPVHLLVRPTPAGDVKEIHHPAARFYFNRKILYAAPEELRRMVARGRPVFAAGHVDVLEEFYAPHVAGARIETLARDGCYRCWQIEPAADPKESAFPRPKWRHERPAGPGDPEARL